MNVYYVYRHVRLDTGEVFYVGKGHGKRAFNSSDRNQYWSRVFNITDFRVEIIEKELSENSSFEREIYWIAYYKNLGQCKGNFQLGGGSCSQGLKHTCIDCKTKLANIYAKRCQKCRTAFKKTEEYKSIHSAGQIKRFQNPEQRKLVASLRLGKSPPNKGVTGYKLSEDHKKRISDGLRRRNASS